jgi:hypothetical protein
LGALAQRIGNTLTRGEYLALNERGIVTPEDVVAAEREVLQSIIGAGPTERLLQRLKD